MSATPSPEELDALAETCLDRMRFAANHALRSRPGSTTSTEWIAEAAHYAAVASALRAKEQGRG